MQRHMPIGYRMVNGTIEIDEEQSRTIRNIFKDYINGKSMIAIAKELTATKIVNANKKPNWNHGSVGKILQNVKYKGDALYPLIIDEDTFKKVQELRKVKEVELGRTAHINSIKKQNIFKGKISCGECGEAYKKYIEHAGKASEKTRWKCKRYIFENRVLCRNLFYTDEELKAIFIDATNELLKRKWMMENVQKKEPPKMSLELRQTENRIKELEQEESFSSQELAVLIFKRAELFYKGSMIDDHKSNTEKLKAAFADEEIITEFDEELFEIIIKQITVYKDSKVEVEFINGIIITKILEYKRKDGKHGIGEEDGSNYTATS